VLTLLWTRAWSRRRREIIQGVGEAQGPLRAMRTKARDSFIGALRDARRWLDELLIDPTQTIESLAMREHKSERSIRMTVSLAFVSPFLAKAATEGRLPRGFSVKRLTDLPCSGPSNGAQLGCESRFRFEPNSADPHFFNSLRTLYWRGRCFGPSASIVQPGKRNFASKRLAGEFRRRARKNGRNSVRRPAAVR